MGSRVRERRDELGYPRRLVADKVAEMTGRNYRENWLSGIERGETGIYLNAAIALADVLGMSMDEMVGRRIGPDIVIEGQAVEVKQPLDDLDHALEPVDSLADGAAAPIPLDEARRGRKRAGARPRRT
jgi:transcriptional regulator with XRE-family HTH domain